MKNYYSINEDFFDDVETSEITDTEIENENEPFVETVPSDLNESIKLEVGIIITNLKKVTEIIKKIEPYIKYTLDAWNGLRYYEKFTYIYEEPNENFRIKNEKFLSNKFIFILQIIGVLLNLIPLTLMSALFIVYPYICFYLFDNCNTN